jgi:Fe-S-cluster containining protein
MPHGESWENILASVENGQKVMDLLCASAAADYRSKNGEIFCGKGCSSCCTLAVNCTAAEALLIAQALDQEQSEKLKDYVARLKVLVGDAVDLKGYLRLHRKELGGCPFLDGGICGVYSVRPISCRALLSTKVNRWCAADFSELPPAEKLAFIESLDRKAVAFPMHYLACTQDAAQKLEAQASMQMVKEFGFSLSGSMPVLVYLFKECRLIDRSQKDAAG